MSTGPSIGRFYPVDSPLHALDPRAKILAAASLVVGTFFVGPVAGSALVAAALTALVAASRVPPGVFLGSLKPVALILAVVFFFQVFLSCQGETLLEWGVLEVHAGGLRMGLLLSVRIVLLVVTAGLLTATTSPISLTDGTEDLLSPLRRIRFPAHEVAMMVTVALRFIPTLYEEAQKVMKAQAARGADFTGGGPIQRLRSLVPVLIPLTVGAFRRADELAEAMESRGYRGGEGRTRYRELRFRVRDALALAVAVPVGGALL